MLKKLAAIFLMLAFASQTFSGFFIMLDYYVNTAAFAKNCENKARPKMHCNGKCQMMKKLKAEEKKDQQAPERKFENKAEVLSSKSFYCSIERDYSFTGTRAIAFEKNHPLTDIAYAFFHPPQA